MIAKNSSGQPVGDDKIRPLSRLNLGFAKSFRRAAVLLLAFSALVPQAFQATLEWNDSNPKDAVIGYRVYSGTRSGEYTDTADAGSETSWPIPSLQSGCTYYFAVTAYDADGLESELSDEVGYTVPVDGVSAVAVPVTISMSPAASSVALAFAVTNAQRCYVQASTNLHCWQTIGVFDATNGPNVWLAGITHDAQNRFYRVIASRDPIW